MTASRTCHSTSSNGCVPSVVKYRVNVRPSRMTSTSPSFVATDNPSSLSADHGPGPLLWNMCGWFGEKPHPCDYGSVILTSAEPHVNMMCREFLSHTTCSVSGRAPRFGRGLLLERDHLPF